MGYAFSSYAVPRSSASCAGYFRDATWIVRPPRGLIELSLLVECERQKFGAMLGREPTVAELAERLDRPHAAVSAAVEAHASRVPRSLDSTADDAEPDPATIGDVIGLDDAEYERAEARTPLSGYLDPRSACARRAAHALPARPQAVGDRSGDRLLADAGLPDHQEVARAAVRPRLHGLRRMVDERHNEGATA